MASGGRKLIEVRGTGRVSRMEPANRGLDTEAVCRRWGAEIEDRQPGVGDLSRSSRERTGTHARPEVKGLRW